MVAHPWWRSIQPAGVMGRPWEYRWLWRKLWMRSIESLSERRTCVQRERDTVSKSTLTELLQLILKPNPLAMQHITTVEAIRMKTEGIDCFSCISFNNKILSIMISSKIITMIKVQCCIRWATRQVYCVWKTLHSCQCCQFSNFVSSLVTFWIAG